MADTCELASIQRWLSALILDPRALDRDEEGARRLRIADDDLRTERLLAYVNGYPARLFEAMSEAYPALKHVVGDQAFGELTNRYRFHVPVGLYSLSDVGARLPQFLRNDALSDDFAFAADLAELEWRVQCAFHSFERKPFDVSALSEWTMEDWETATVEFQPSVFVVSSAWPVLEIWSVRETPVEEIDVDLRDNAQCVLIFRRGLRVRCEPLSAEQASILDSLAAGSPLGKTMEALAEDGVAPETVLSLFQRMAAGGLLTSCEKAAG
jgi:hypothetical protein